MKNKLFYIILTFTLTSCPFPYEDDYYEYDYIPVYISREALENSVKFIKETREMEHTGKIYYYAPYIFVNERYRGVHVFNNSDPSKPVKEGFINAPGCIDMAVKENILYLDNSVDLVSFDMNSKEVTNRIRNVFPEPLPPDDIFYYRRNNRPKGYILVNWIKKEQNN